MSGRLTPVLRSFDEETARKFYVDFLGFEVGFSHRFEEGLPLYMGLSGYDTHIHLTEHHGDACPGAHIRIEVDNVEDLSQQLRDKNYGFARPEVGEETPWGTREMTVTDPFGNRLTFVGPAS